MSILGIAPTRTAPLGQRRQIAWKIALLAFTLAVGALSLAPAAARADNPFEAWARHALDPERHYRGPTVVYPEPAPRPATVAWRVCSDRCSLCVHAPEQMPAHYIRAALAALEHAHASLDALGWPLPYPDGGAGGTLQFDVYLSEGTQPWASATVETPIAFSALDAASSHGMIEGTPRGEALEGCALAVLAEAGLIATDPGEGEVERRATAGYAAWVASGALGCGLERQPAAPQLGPLGDEREHVAVLARWLVYVARQHAALATDPVREVWDVARQRSEQRWRPRARPSFWQAFAALLEREGDSLEASAQSFAIARWFEQPAEDDRKPESDRTLPGARNAQRALGVYGSGYLLVERGAAPDATLRAWLRGEPPGRYAFGALRLDQAGRDHGRVTVPTTRASSAYLPVELDPDTRRVLFVTTRIPDRDADGAEPREPLSYRVVLDSR